MTNRTPKARPKTPATRKAPTPAPAVPPDVTTVSGRLRYARELRGLSSRELGIAAGLSSGAVSAVENAPDGGDNARVGSLRELARVLDVPAAWLAFGVGAPPRASTAE